ncbi:MAG: hypothetical protein AB1422_08820 [bacterium]
MNTDEILIFIGRKIFCKRSDIGKNMVTIQPRMYTDETRKIPLIVFGRLACP